MHVERQTITLTTDGSGSGTAYTGVARGCIRHIIYAKDGSAPFTGGTISITGRSTGLAILSIAGTASAGTLQPYAPAHSSADGAPLLFAAGGAPVPAPIFVAGEQIQFSISTGGANKTGTFTLVIDGTFS